MTHAHDQACKSCAQRKDQQGSALLTWAFKCAVELEQQKDECAMELKQQKDGADGR